MQGTYHFQRAAPGKKFHNEIIGNTQTHFDAEFIFIINQYLLGMMQGYGFQELAVERIVLQHDFFHGENVSLPQIRRSRIRSTPKVFSVPSSYANKYQR